MNYRTIYHGSSVVVRNPVFHSPLSNPHNDFGPGFYCTMNINMAKEWANRTVSHGFVSKYVIDERSLSILDMTDETKYGILNWISILMHFRDIAPNVRLECEDELEFISLYYVDVERYDVVIGYRADDAYFRFPTSFLRNHLTLEKLEEIYRLGNLGKQYALISEKSFKHIRFQSEIPAEPIYQERYFRRKEEANRAYFELEMMERRNSDGTRIRDLMREYHD